jgi:hypothetical protein
MDSVRRLKEQHGHVLSRAEKLAQSAQQHQQSPTGTPIMWDWGRRGAVGASSASAALLLRARLGGSGSRMRQKAVALSMCGGAGELWRAPEALFADLGDGRGLPSHCAAVVARCELESRSALMVRTPRALQRAWCMGLLLRSDPSLAGYSYQLATTCPPAGRPARVRDDALQTRARARRPPQGNVLLAGGTTCFSGFQARLQEELREVWGERAGGGDRCRVLAPANRK